ncbi:MAG: hypothetical protein P4L87_24300 [Formivibrio sp.]|nr:hypothetical protein [Formivibrio sp.]
MNSQIGKNGIARETHDAVREWLSETSLILFVISTTVFDVRIMAIGSLSLSAVLLPLLIFVQGYIIWYYFNRFRPARKKFAISVPEIARSYVRLFAVAMIGTSVVALVGILLLRSGWVAHP